MAKGSKVCLSTSKHYSLGLGKTNEVGRKPNHDHILLARLEPVPKDNVASSRMTKMLPALRGPSVKCSNQVGNPKGHEIQELTAWRLT